MSISLVCQGASRLALAAILFFAGVSKAFSITEKLEIVSLLRELIVAIVEMLMAFLLISPYWRRAVSPVACLFLVLTSYSIYLMVFVEEETKDCGCFGDWLQMTQLRHSLLLAGCWMLIIVLAAMRRAASNRAGSGPMAGGMDRDGETPSTTGGT